ncbi:hypothetical protein KPL71_007442 [Citrus sinensis]|uniref:Uncharacterized protein n=1 Tax=Citrus sinensis TaxID=2711 RepID=A0ACB8LZJ8_CITSI|nr:hypothetical protein KPL71_007442 [Citrus sinensis]
MNIRPNWELKQCCNHEQFVFLVTVSVCAAVILPSLWGTAQIWIILVSNLTPFIDLLWRTILLKPFKLVTVFLHEASHAIACKLTCGKVEGSQVHADEGGTTQTRGGVYWFILPAGCMDLASLIFMPKILRSSFIFLGMLLILASTTLLTARIAAGCLVAALLVVLLVAKNIFMTMLVSISNFISLRSAISFFFGDDDSSLYSYTLFLQTFQSKVFNFEL